MNILYISSSVFPSKSANSINVMRMGSAFSKKGYKINVLGIQGENKKNIFDYYSIEESFQVTRSKNSILSRVIDIVRSGRNADLVYSRWALGGLIAASLLNKPLIFEFHHLPQKRLTKWIEKRILSNKNLVLSVFITKKLLEDYIDEYVLLDKLPTIVAPDGADVQKATRVKENETDVYSCVYLGSLYEGKGINIVLEIAVKMSSREFHIIGGTSEQINRLKEKYKNKNIIWYGHLEQKEAFKVMSRCDIALLPNQEKVILGDNKTDIGKWTSPLKMFEYMSFGKKIIASDLPILKEVLVHRKNSILVSPTDIQEWIKAINELEVNKELGKYISLNAKNDLESKYTWESRVENIMTKLDKRNY